MLACLRAKGTPRTRGSWATLALSASALLLACSSRQPDFILSVTVDFFGDTSQGLYTPRTLDLMMGQIRGLGARRIYWQYYGELDQEQYGAGSNIFSADESRFGAQTLNEIGEPLAAAVKAAHAHGLEIYGELKPFHTGISATYPQGSRQANPQSPLRRIGGTIQRYNPFMARYPHTRIKRRPPEPQTLQSAPVRRIRLVKSDDLPTRIGANDLEIWTSADNYRYERAHVEFSLEETVEKAPHDVRDYYGERVTQAGDPVRVLTLSGLELHEPYVVVATDFAAGAADFTNTAVAMIQVFAGDDDHTLPIVVATADATWIRPRDYRTYGLEFDSGYGHRRMRLDVPRSPAAGGQRDDAQDDSWREHRAELGLTSGGGFIAFARGKNEYLPTAPSEAYPEVRELWLWRIDRMLAKGVDGVVLRVSAHGTLTDEPYEYGFNEPVVAAYIARYGTDPLTGHYDPARLAELRGEFYTQFVREASRRTRARGKKFFVQLHSEAFRSEPVFGQIMGFPANLSFDWRTWLEEDLVDGVVLRAAWYEAAEDPLDGSPPRRSRLDAVLADPVVREMIEAARARGLPVHVNRYVGRAIPSEQYAKDIEMLYRDGRFAGFDVYEFFHLARAKADGSALVPVGDRIARIRQIAAKLGIGAAEPAHKRASD